MVAFHRVSPADGSVWDNKVSNTPKGYSCQAGPATETKSDRSEFILGTQEKKCMEADTLIVSGWRLR